MGFGQNNEDKNLRNPKFQTPDFFGVRNLLRFKRFFKILIWSFSAFFDFSKSRFCYPAQNKKKIWRVRILKEKTHPKVNTILPFNRLNMKRFAHLLERWSTL